MIAVIRRTILCSLDIAGRSAGPDAGCAQLAIAAGPGRVTAEAAKRAGELG